MRSAVAERRFGAMVNAANALSSTSRTGHQRPIGAECDTGRLVLRLIPARADAKLESTTGQVMQSRGFVSHQRRMPEVIGQYERANSQSCRHRRGGSESAERGQLLTEGRGRKVIADKQ